MLIAFAPPVAVGFLINATFASVTAAAVAVIVPYLVAGVTLAMADVTEAPFRDVTVAALSTLVANGSG